MQAGRVTTENKKRSANRYWIEIKGKIYARLQYKTEAGTYKVKYRRITDKRTARSIVEEMRNELKAHGEELFASEKMTFEELLAKYEDTELVAASYQNGVKIRGRRSLAPVLSAIKPLRLYFGSKAIRSIKPTDLTSYKNERLVTPIEIEINVKEIRFDTKTGRESVFTRKEIRLRERKIASVNRELSVLKTVLNFAVTNDWLIKNPFEKTKGIISTTAEVERDRVLSFEEEERLLNACNGGRSHIKPILTCALDTAMRRGEIFKMRWADVDLARNQITIPQTNTKTEESRIVGITPRLRNEFEKLWDDSPKKKDQTVFGISNTIKTAFKSACVDAKILDFRFHDCRHTATTRMVASGSPHTEVMKITGHSQLTTFLRYLNITQETANKVAKNLSDYLNKQVCAIETVSEAVS